MHTLRLLARTPLFTLTAVLSLAVGIGANAAIFSTANALFLAPTVGVRDPGRLVDIGRTTDGSGFDTVSYPTFADLVARDSVFEGVFASRLEPVPLSLGGDDGAERIYGEQVTSSYFDVLGLVPAAGTFFHATEEHVGTPLRKVVLTHSFWQTRFAARPDVIGSEITLNGERFTVAGVAPRGFRGATVLTSDVWIPATAHSRGVATEETLRSRDSVWLIMTARLKPGVTIDQAQAFLNSFVANLTTQHPEQYERRGFVAMPSSRVGGFGREFVAPFLGILMGATGLVLLVTGTNLAGLLVARAASRSREVAVRLALGASRRSLVGLLMREAFAVSAVGSLAALALAWWISRALASVVASLPFPITIDISLDWRVLAFTAGVAFLTACLIGLAPAWQSARANLVTDLKSDASAPRRQRLRQIFITAQLAFCLVLVVAAGLFLRALTAAGDVDPGFDVDRVDVATVDLALGGYTDAQSSDIADRLREQLATIPGLASMGFARMIPLDGGGMGLGGLRAAGTSGPEARIDIDIDTDWNVVSPEYFSALGLPLLRGRPFTSADREDTALVAIVNERFANQVWPGQDPIGRQLENGDFRPGRSAAISTITVVGVARDAKYRWVGEAPAPFIYVPFKQQSARTVNYFLSRGRSADGYALEPSVRQVLKTFDRNLPLVTMRPLKEYALVGLLPQRLAASVAGSLGVVALLLAGIGIYGVTAFAVASRTREIGLRIALGADRTRVMRMVLWQGARLAAIGGGAGLLMSVGATQLLSSLLFGVSPLDPLTYAATAGVLAAVTLAATFVPARRAASVNPLIALKSD